MFFSDYYYLARMIVPAGDTLACEAGGPGRDGREGWQGREKISLQPSQCLLFIPY